MYLSRLAVEGFRASAVAPLSVDLPGRFAVLLGANSGGKTTVCDAAYLVHRHRFPTLPALNAAALGPRAINRLISVDYTFEATEAAEGPLGRRVWAQSGGARPGESAASWSAALTRNLGSIRTEMLQPPDMLSQFRLVYLPAWRNPIDQLARREARVLVELLRSQQQWLTGSRNLQELRSHAGGLLQALAGHPIISAVERRIAGQISALSAGVSKQWPYVRGQVVGDEYLARVLELMLAVLEGRDNARPLDVSGLGYVNLLHIAVTLAAIPDYTRQGEGDADSGATGAADGDVAEPKDSDPSTTSHAEEQSTQDADRETIAQAGAERDSEEDSFFGSGPFHATVVIEEPEAHLHPQLQHSLVRHLKRVVDERPEIQILLSSHATDIITSCEPEELVVLRKQADGGSRANSIAAIPMKERNRVMRMTRLHLDTNRSASLFADRVMLVEGITEVAVVRQFGWLWAGDDLDKRSFIDALSIIAMGTKVGSWPVRLLATPKHELVDRLALLRDTDAPLESAPVEPAWLSDHESEVVRVFHSHPTLEPAITSGNEPLVAAALEEVGLEVPDVIEVSSVRAIFAGKRAATDGDPGSPAGPGAGKKAEFALALAAALSEAIHAGPTATVPGHLAALFDFLWGSEGGSPPAPDAADEDAS